MSIDFDTSQSGKVKLGQIIKIKNRLILILRCYLTIIKSKTLVKLFWLFTFCLIKSKQKIKALQKYNVFLIRRYLPAIQGMGDGTIPYFCRCCVLLRTCLSHIPPAKNHYCIFIRPVLRKKVLAWGKTGSEGFCK